MFTITQHFIFLILGEIEGVKVLTTRMFHDDKGVEESSHQLTTIQIHRKKTIAHHEKISTVTFPERHYLYYRRHPHSTTPKTETKKVTMINACQLPPLERPFSVSAIKMYVRIKINFTQLSSRKKESLTDLLSQFNSLEFVS